MNAAARALAQSNWVEGSFSALSMTKKGLAILLLVIAVLSSAFAVVYTKTLNRRLFTDLQILQQQRDSLQVEWSQLLLEQSTWATQARIQQIAQNNLQMITPAAKEVVIIKERE